MAAQWRLLTEYLRGAIGRVRLSWAELDEIVGGMPASAVDHYPQWWHGDRPNTRAWRAAGYEAEQVDPGVSVLFLPRGDMPVALNAGDESGEAATSHQPSTGAGPSGDLGALDPVQTLVLIPCSASKRRGGTRDAPSPASKRLALARGSVLALADTKTDEALVMPAFRRYDGNLYRACETALAELAASRRLLILSGGYGVLEGSDFIGRYDRLMRTSDWPLGLLEQLLAEYAANLDLDVVAFFGASTEYAKVIRRTRWQLPRNRNAYLVSLQGMRGSRAVSSALGVALRCFIEGGTDGYPPGMVVERLTPRQGR